MKIKTTFLLLVVLVSSCTFATKSADNISTKISSVDQMPVSEKASLKREEDTTSEIGWVSTSLEKGGCRGVGCSFFGVGSELYSFSDSGQVSVWSQQAGNIALQQKKSGKISFQNRQKIDLVKLSADGAYLVTAQGRTVTVIDQRSWKVAAKTEQIPTKATCFDFSSDNKKILIGGADGRVYLWHFLNEENLSRPIERYFDHNAPVTAVIFHPSGQAFFSADWNGVVTAWRVYQDEQRRTKDFRTNSFLTTLSMKKRYPRAIGEAIDKLYLTVDGEALIMIAAKGSVELWRTRDGKREDEIMAHNGLIKASAFNGQLMKLVTVGRDGFVRAWRVSTFGSAKWELSELSSKENRQISQIVILDDGSVNYLSQDGEVGILASNS